MQSLAFTADDGIAWNWGATRNRLRVRRLTTAVALSQGQAETGHSIRQLFVLGKFCCRYQSISGAKRATSHRKVVSNFHVGFAIFAKDTEYLLGRPWIASRMTSRLAQQLGWQMRDSILSLGFVTRLVVFK